MTWEWVTAFLTALGAVIGSSWTIKRVIAHEQRECDARLDAFKQGLEQGRGHDDA